MTIDNQLSSIESSFKIEDMLFDDECRERIRAILSHKLSVEDAIAELNNKYKTSSKQK